ncbi:Tuberous sclerosis 1 [Hypsizygus marmoreus]|uniref:Tuberous sclerosis 1 n=1 Tax=Hypsizygus marmoreus TaxID=39966 RepID=A0A369JRY1_HYPMA|nr:Tuberous sclerosis 1 [Hypsizygus marmoreus]
MPTSILARQVRAVLECVPDAPHFHELLSLIDDFVHECSSSPEPEVMLFRLEEDLQKVHDEVVDHSSLYQTEVFLAVLYHLGPILPPTSVISWFDIVLRPALREPKLPTLVVNHAKELIISALQKVEEAYLEKVGEFRRRLLDLYLLDAFNEGSGSDVLEWAELDEEQREKRAHWKWNLEDILLKFGTERPQDLMTELHIHFANPTSRLQLFMLLNLYTSSPSFDTSSAVLAAHPLMRSVLLSLLLDTSSTVCTAGLTLIVKLLPVLAVHARNDLKPMLPKLLAVLARIMCWKERPPSDSRGPADEPPDPEFERELESETNRLIPIRPDLEWERLQLTFNATTSHPPSPRPYFSILYYLYPSNVLQFLSGPAHYLMSTNTRSPYTMDWDKALAQDEIRRKSEHLIREHVCHPLLIWRDAAAEVSEHEFWARYSVARITSEAEMLDVRNSALGILAHCRDSGFPTESIEPGSAGEENPDLPVHLIRSIDLSSEKASISLQDMISTTIALKSNMDVDVVKPTSQWPRDLFPVPAQDSSEEPPPHSSGEIPSQVIRVISELQRELLLLRNELNFEVWLSRENVKHIGRLYQDRVLTRSAEAERQGLYNKLRNYRAQVISLEAELREHKQQASSAKNKYADWNTELQKKLKEFREEKKAWLSEAASLRSAEKEAQALFAAQGKLLAEASKEVFELRTQKKETQHKIDRLKDYERQIEQHIKMQQLWDKDFVKFNERGEEMMLMHNQYQQMKLQLESFEKTMAEMEDAARVQRRRIQSLEAQLTQAQALRQGTQAKHRAEIEIATFSAEKAALMDQNKRLKDENVELKDEVEEMRAMLEVLKGQHSGRKGLVSEPRASPVQFV